MDNTQIIRDVFEILGKTFKALDEAYGDKESGNKERFNNPFMSTGSYIVFPVKIEKGGKKGKNVTRVSEQELRFEFIHQLLNYNHKYFYSIETPTTKKYKHFSKTDTEHPVQDDSGRSAMFDLVLFDENGERVCLLEFKSGCADQIEYEKDILKLNEEGKGKPCFFINLLENFEDSTLERIGYKIQGKDEKNIPSINAIKTDSDIFFITHNVGEYTGKGNDNKHYSLLFAQNDERKNLWNNPFKQEKEEWIIIPYEDGKLELNDDEIKKLVNK